MILRYSSAERFRHLDEGHDSKGKRPVHFVETGDVSSSEVNNEYLSNVFTSGQDVVWNWEKNKKRIRQEQKII